MISSVLRFLVAEATGIAAAVCAMAIALGNAMMTVDGNVVDSEFLLVVILTMVLTIISMWASSRFARSSNFLIQLISDFNCLVQMVILVEMVYYLITEIIIK